jgi:hypothetical protein
MPPPPLRLAAALAALVVSALAAGPAGLRRGGTLHPRPLVSRRVAAPARECCACTLAASSVDELHALVGRSSAELAARLPPRPSGAVITYSRKVFIPLTRLCRDRCTYCTFAQHEGLSEPDARAYLSVDEVLEIARAGAAAGCTEALFTLGDRPEARWPAAREELRELGYASTVEYLAACCKAVLEQTELLPHANCGVLSEPELAMLREVSASQGLMLESTSERLFEPGGPHHRSACCPHPFLLDYLSMAHSQSDLCLLNTEICTLFSDCLLPSVRCTCCPQVSRQGTRAQACNSRGSGEAQDPFHNGFAHRHRRDERREARCACRHR